MTLLSRRLRRSLDRLWRSLEPEPFKAWPEWNQADLAEQQARKAHRSTRPHRRRKAELLHAALRSGR